MKDAHHGYTLPEAFLDLDEVVVPSPASHREDENRLSLEHVLSEEKNNLRDDRSVDRADSAVLPPEERVSQRSEMNGNLENGETLFHSGTSSRPSLNTVDSQKHGSPAQYDSHSRAHRNVSRNQPQGYHGHLTEVSAPPPVSEPYRSQEPSLEERPSEKSSETSELVAKLYTVCYLIFFSIWGTLARLGVQALTVYPGAPVTQGVLWPNVGGSLIMGFLAEDRRLFRGPWGTVSTSLTRAPTPERNKRYTALKKTIPLYIGLSTGFCGCFTSFSSWERDSFLAMANAATPSPLPRNGGYSFLALLATLILTPTLCLGALQLGAHLALLLEPITPRLSFRFTCKVVDPAIVPIALLSWLAAVFLAIWPPDRPSGPSDQVSWLNETWRGDAIFACIFAPLGCLTRFYISLWLNARLPAFPLGTFTVNIFGSIMEAVFYDLQHARLGAGIGGGFVGCQALQGLMDGYCGSTTTISTWVAELKGLRRRHAYIYGGLSTFIGLAFMIIILGSLHWTEGFQVTACGK